MGKLTRSDLDEVVRVQKEINMELGVRALLEGLITLEGFKTIYERQCREVRPFEHIAIAEGLMNPEQMERLRGTHARKHARLGELLVRKGLVTEADVTEALEYELRLGD